MVLADGSDLEDEESVEEDFGDLEGESDLENCSARSQDEVFLKVRFNLCCHVTGLHC